MDSNFDYLVEEFNQISNNKWTASDELKEDTELQRLAKIVKPCILLRYLIKIVNVVTVIMLQYPREKRNQLEKSIGKRLAPWQIHGYAIRFYSPLGKRYSCPLRAYLIWIFAAYESCKIVIICCLHLFYEEQLTVWQQSMNDIPLETNFTDSRCIIRSKLAGKYVKNVRNLEYYTETLYTFGSPVQTINELLTFSMLSIVSLLWIMAFFAGLHRNNDNFRFDALTFFMDPLIEKARIKCKAVDYRESIYSINEQAIERFDLTTSSKTPSMEPIGRRQRRYQSIYRRSEMNNDNNQTMERMALESNVRFKMQNGCDSQLQHQNDFEQDKYRKLYEKFTQQFESNGYLSFESFLSKKTCENQDIGGSNNNYDNNINQKLPFPDEKQFFRLTNWFEQTISRDKNAKNVEIMHRSGQNHDKLRNDNFASNNDDENPIYKLFQGSGIELRINPEHLTLNAYNSLCNLYTRIPSIVIGIAFFIGQLIMIGTMYREITNRLDQRREEFYCLSLHRDAVSRKWPIRLFPIIQEPSINDSNSNRSHVNDNEHINYHVKEPTFGGELGLVMSNGSTIWLVIEIIIGYTMIAHQFGVYMVALMSNNWIQSTWMGQIQKQLSLIGQMMDSYTRKQLLFQDKIKKLTNNDSLIKDDCEILNKFKEDIERSLTGAYLNLMVYRRDLRCHLAFFKFMVYHIILCLLVGSFLCYNILSSGRNHLIVWTVMILIFSLINLIGYMSVNFTSNLNKLSAKMNKLMAKSARLSLESSNVISLWRRQIMSTSDVEETFGISILGVEFSHSNLIQFNSYVFGASLYLLKSYFV